MAVKYYLGIDIGASSGRHVLGHKENGELVMEEIYRFPNQIQNRGGRDCWDMEALFAHVVEGIRRCTGQQKLPCSLSIDTWGCDFVLLDEQERRVGDCVSYRDNRVDGMPERAFQILAKEKVYQKTGIQFQKFNTLYQLLALQAMQPEELAAAAHFLMIPDYLHYRLTGRITNEYTNASTTQIVNAAGQVWDQDILAAFGLPRRIFKDFTPVGEVIGGLTEAVKKAAGLEPGQDILVLEGATHDTASAFAGARQKDGLILSSGTWSLLGKIVNTPVVTETAQKYNFTNEGYPGGRYRFLKNIMGLWMIQEVRRGYENRYSFAQLAEMAGQCKQKPPLVDVNDDRFLHPDSMIEAIRQYCRESGQAVPETVAEIANTVYHSLAFSYKKAVKELESITGETYAAINIVGGGCRNEYLNRLTAQYTGKEIVTGPDEATVAGNILLQIKAQEKN